MSKKCTYCLKKIDENDYIRYCSLITYEKKNKIEVKWFHLNCFIDWHNYKVGEKAKNIVEELNPQAMAIAKKVLEDNNILIQ